VRSALSVPTSRSCALLRLRQVARLTQNDHHLVASPRGSPPGCVPRFCVAAPEIRLPRRLHRSSRIGACRRRRVSAPTLSTTRVFMSCPPAAWAACSCGGAGACSAVVVYSMQPARPVAHGRVRVRREHAQTDESPWRGGAAWSCTQTPRSTTRRVAPWVVGRGSPLVARETRNPLRDPLLAADVSRHTLPPENIDPAASCVPTPYSLLYQCSTRVQTGAVKPALCARCSVPCTACVVRSDCSSRMADGGYLAHRTGIRDR